MAKCCDDKNAPAKFNRQVDFQSLTLTPDDTGAQSEAWTTFLAGAWVSLTPKNVYEKNFAQRIEPRIVHEIRLRYYPGIVASMRVVYGSRIFEIKSIINEEEGNEYLKIIAEERTGT